MVGAHKGRTSLCCPPCRSAPSCTPRRRCSPRPPRRATTPRAQTCALPALCTPLLLQHACSA
eukprot:scaffold2549_cov108-Isochrysis_galbana.AAC.14